MLKRCPKPPWYIHRLQCQAPLELVQCATTPGLSCALTPSICFASTSCYSGDPTDLLMQQKSHLSAVQRPAASQQVLPPALVSAALGPSLPALLLSSAPVKPHALKLIRVLGQVSICTVCKLLRRIKLSRVLVNVGRPDSRRQRAWAIANGLKCSQPQPQATKL